jgi:hypothetical protein
MFPTKRRTIYVSAGVLCCLLAGWLAATLVAWADPPKVERKDNHLSPLMAELTFRDEKVKPVKVMVYGVKTGTASVYYTKHHYELTGDGDTRVKVWLDTIREIKEIDDKRLTVVFKDGAERQFRHGREQLLLYHPDDSTEEVPLVKLREVKFLKAPRQDKEKQAMFGHWRYSPFTGEKLPPVEDEK